MDDFGGLIVYRGQIQLERSRIEFLIDSAIEARGAVEILHLSPLGSPDRTWDAIVASRPGIRGLHVVDAGLLNLITVRRLVRTALQSRELLMGVGFSAAAFLPPGATVLWCVNGIPEERLLTRNSLAARLSTRLSWWVARRVRARRMVVVSEPMALLVQQRVPRAHAVVVPNTVDTETFARSPLPEASRTALTYLGGGSPWQGLARLSLVWAEVHRIQPTTRFMVISRDPRTRVLANALPGDVIDFVSSDDPDQIATWLSGSRLGFLFRQPSVVNRVSWPMKFGEYVAAGVPVAVSQCGWDIERLVEECQAGVVLRWEDDASVTARRIVDYLCQTDSDDAEGVRQAAAYLDSKRWREHIAETLRESLHDG